MQYNKEAIEILLEEDNEVAIQQYLHNNLPQDIAEILETLNLVDSLKVFRLCDATQKREIFIQLSDETQIAYVESLSLDEISQIVANLESDDVTYIFSEIHPDRAEEILKNIDKTESVRIRTQLNFDENTAGRIMTYDFAVCQIGEDATQAIENLRKAAKKTDEIYVIYVTDARGVVKGYIKLKDLILTSSDTRIYKLMKPIKTIHYATDQEEVARFFQKYDLVSAPVVDNDGRIMGRITVDDVLDVVQDEASEDILRLGGVSEEEKLASSVLTSMKTRVVWLFLNLGTAAIASSVVTLFEDTIQRLVVLASLMPIVAGLGGNAGTQAITVMVRSIATGELTDKNSLRAVTKEFSIAILNGLSIGFVAASMVFIIKGDYQLSFVIGLAMLMNLTIAGVVGSITPLILKFFKIDPAVASSIFVTACTDISGFFIFLGFAKIFID